MLAAVKEAKSSTKQLRGSEVKSSRTEEKQQDRSSRQAELAARREANEARTKGAGFSPLQISRARAIADAAELRAARRAAAQAAKAGSDDEASEADADADGDSVEAILAAATADAEVDAAGVVVTTKKRILESAPELLLDKNEAPIMKRWYTVTVRAAMPCSRCMFSLATDMRFCTLFLGLDAPRRGGAASSWLSRLWRACCRRRRRGRGSPTCW